MNPPSSATVTAALITAAASLVVAVVSALLKQRSDRALETFKAGSNQALEDFKSGLAQAQAEHGARLAYEYEARKHLYAEFYPLLFQLVEACESAYDRIGGLAIAAREQLLKGFLCEDGYRFQTVYRLLYPLAVFRLCQSKLTSVDLTVDPWVRAQYLTAKQLYGIWISSAELAAAGPDIRYRPFSTDSEPGHGRTDPRQHLSVADVELLIEALQVRGDKGPSRCRSFGEFIAWKAGLESEEGRRPALLDSVAYAMALFEGFHPSTRPVLWRTLLAEARVCKLLIRAFEAHAIAADGDGGWKQSAKDLLFMAEERADLDWTRPDSPAEDRAQVAGGFQAVPSYLKDRLARYGLYGSRTADDRAMP
jgi:hypothetical protein